MDNWKTSPEWVVSVYVYVLGWGSEWKGEATAGRVEGGSLELTLTPWKTSQLEIQDPEGGGTLWVVQISPNAHHFQTQDASAKPAKPYSKACEFPKRFNFQV